MDVNEQVIGLIKAELVREGFAHATYTQAYQWLRGVGYFATADAFYKQGQEELEHQKKLIDYLVDLRIPVAFPAIDAPVEFNSIQAVIAEALRLEHVVLEAFREMVDIAWETHDVMAFQFFQWFVAEQYTSISALNDVQSLLTIGGVAIDKAAALALDEAIAEVLK